MLAWNRFYQEVSSGLWQESEGTLWTRLASWYHTGPGHQQQSLNCSSNVKSNNLFEKRVANKKNLFQAVFLSSWPLCWSMGCSSSSYGVHSSSALWESVWACFLSCKGEISAWNLCPTLILLWLRALGHDAVSKWHHWKNISVYVHTAWWLLMLKNQVKDRLLPWKQDQLIHLSIRDSS